MTTERRTVLVASPFLPYPPDFGGALRVYHLVRGLARQHDVHLVVPVTSDEIDHVLALGDICDVSAVPAERSVRQAAAGGKRLSQLASLLSSEPFLLRSFDSEAMTTVIDRILATRSIDLIQYEFVQTALAHPSRPIPTIIDAHNIEYDLLRRVARTSHGGLQQAFNLLEWRKARRMEERLWRGATAVVATSRPDAEVIEAATGRSVPVVPNGVDLEAFAGIRRETRPGRVVFTGAMRHHPNADGAVWYATKIHPLVRAAVPHAELLIVGADPPPDVLALASDSVMVTGRVERVEPYLADAAVSVVPLRSGGGTRLKILEAFAARAPVVSTTIGAEGIEARDNVQLLIRDDPDNFAEAVIALLQGNGPAGYSVEHGYDLAASEYTWDGAVVPRLLAAHDLAIERFRQSDRG